VAIDPASSRFLYVGTDVGAFVSSDGGTTWSEYGNLLPAVPVTAMNTFVGGGARKLRISTYGRGIWEVDLPVVATDFDLAANATTPTSFAAGGSISFNVALTPKVQNPGNITLTVTNLPTLASYQFAGFGVNQPATVSLGAAPANISLTITTTHASAVLNHPPARGTPWFALGLAVPTLVFCNAGLGRRSRRRWICRLGVVGLLVLGGMFCLSCGGGGAAANLSARPGTPPGAYAVVIQGDSASTTATAVVNFNVQ
jgi:hypothetical protein